MPELPGVASFFIRGGRLAVPRALVQTGLSNEVDWALPN
jgi:hypothetical protein